MTDLPGPDHSAKVSWAQSGDAAAVAARIGAELAGSGTSRIALPGGRTPLKIFDSLAQSGADWSGATLVLTDDRQVPHDHPLSNFGALQRALGDSGAQIDPISEGDRLEPFDLVWLGMGEDGHVASLFPQMQARDVAAPQIIATVPEPLPPEAPFPRLSQNMAALTAAGEIILVVTGAAKKALLEGVLAGKDADLPVARLIATASCPVTIYWSE